MTGFRITSRHMKCMDIPTITEADYDTYNGQND